ncbi:MAG TPA: alanine dehydrogenase [Bacteroidales bacterium]|nr:alanine dehydrogenase [Bacteroidales bacterium]
MNKKGGSQINLQKEGLLPREEMLEVGTRQQELVIGIPKEDQTIESRVPLTPEAVEILTGNGHQVIIEEGAGLAANYPDNQYADSGALIVDVRKEVLQADIVLKINPLSLQDIDQMKERAMIISSFQVKMHKEKQYIQKLLSKKVTAVSMELIRDNNNCYPLVRSMSSIAGSTAVLIAGEYLSNARGGKGVMLGGVTGITPTEVVILGAGTVAEFAVRAALGLGALVKVFDESVNRLRRLQSAVGYNIPTSIFHPKVIKKSLKSTDVVIGAVRNNPDISSFLITEEMVKEMKKGSVIVDISIDSGGCIETSELRTQQNPVYTKHGILHYCVPNITSRVARTASIAISNLLGPMLSDMGRAGGSTKHMKQDEGMRHGIYIYKGILTSETLGNRFGLPSKDIELLMAAF